MTEAMPMAEDHPPSTGRKPRADVRISFSMNAADHRLFEEVMEAMQAYSASDAFRRLVWEKHAQIAAAAGGKAAKAKPAKSKKHR